MHVYCAIDAAAATCYVDYLVCVDWAVKSPLGLSDSPIAEGGTGVAAGDHGVVYLPIYILPQVDPGPPH